MSTLTFPGSLPGLDPLRRFTLRNVDGAVGLYSLEAEEMDQVRLFLLDPAVHLPDYDPRLSQHLAEVGAVRTDEVKLLVVANSSEGEICANLLAPVLINAATGTSAQVILEGQDYPVRAPLAAQPA